MRLCLIEYLQQNVYTYMYIHTWRNDMQTKIFKSGNSQAIRIPKDMAFSSKDVEIHKYGNALIVTEIPNDWDKMFEGLKLFSDDFMSSSRKDLLPEIREDF